MANATGAPMEPMDYSASGPDLETVATKALMVAPAIFIVYTGFNAGGFFPGTPALGALILSALLLLRLMLAGTPLQGASAGGLLAAGALIVYSLVALLSATWSHATSRALLAYDRDLLYLLVFTLYLTVRPDISDIRWLIRFVVLGIAIVALSGLVSRVLPNVWHTAPDIANQRLSYPITYWNALGILTALGIILSFHLAASFEEPPLLRICAAALVPPLCATLYFTFSRGSMAATVIGLLVYALVARPRALASAVIATAPVAAAVVYVAYNANLLATPDPTTAAAVKQAHHVVIALAAGIVVTIIVRFVLTRSLDVSLAQKSLSNRISRRHRTPILSSAGVAAVVLIVALNVPGSISHDWSQFLHGAPAPTTDLRARLTSFSSTGRTSLWKVAIHAFDANPLDGQGAGTYQLLWERSEPVYEQNVNAHSLYFETMAETGLLGLIPLLVFVGAVLYGLFRRARGPERAVYAALGSAGLAYFLHTGVDWDWQMPVTGIGVFAGAGLVLSPVHTIRSWNPGQNARMTLGVACIAAAVGPLMIIASQNRLHTAEVELRASKCDAATRSALSEIGWMPSRPEAYEIIGYCDVERGFPKLGVQAMREAIKHDPDNWESYYSLSIAQAAAGIDPRAAAQKALRLNPHDPLAIEAQQTFATTPSSHWTADATRLRSAAFATGQLSISPT
jgi:O-antigen ligase/polysaccharide polymerase Wzy-like membrane protein